MDLLTFRQLFFDQLSGQYPVSEAQAMLKILLQTWAPKDWMQWLSRPSEKLPSDLEEKLQHALEALKQGRPLQYVLGKAWFDGLELEVGEGVLIPRPETEELIHLITEEWKGVHTNPLQILDVGTGSGCIALALAQRFPDAHVDAWDISEKALIIARRNGQRHGRGVQFIRQDVLQWTHAEAKHWDIIVSNPPYIAWKEKEGMEAHVYAHEPLTALFVKDEQPLLFYEAITALAQAKLKPGGSLYFEINPHYASEMIALVEAADFTEVNIIKDMQGKLRMLSARKQPLTPQI